MLAFAVLGCAILSSCAHTTEIKVPTPFVNPFVGLIPKQRPTEASTQICPVPPAPVIDVMSETYYSDSHHSIIDPVRHQRSREKVKPLRTFSNQIARLSDRLWLAKDSNAESCLLNWLTHWRQAGALLGEANYQGEFERKWALSGIALVYLKIEPLVSWTPNQKAALTEWLRKMAKRVRSDYDQKLDRQSRRNNHIYWAGLAVMAGSIATGDRDLYDWGLAKLRQGALDVTADGFLPEELDRARRARHYQSFALQALMMSAFLSQENGMDLLALNNSALLRLAKKTIEGSQDDSVFLRATSTPQESLDPRDLSWTVIYLYLVPMGLPAKKYGNDPVYDAWLGGDLSAVFANRTE